MPPSHRAPSIARRIGLAVATLVAAVLTVSGVVPAYAAGTASISGVVTSTHGEPLPNSSVRVFLPDGSHILKVVGQVYTDANGAFAISGLAAGSYGVHAYGPSGTEYLGESWDNAKSWRTPTVITLGDGEARSGIDLQLALGGVVGGIVTDTAGAPVSGAFIQWQRLDPVPYSADQTVWSTSTDESGAYEVRRVIPGTYRASISISDRSYVTLRSDPIVVAGDVITPFDISLTAASVISGTVTDPQGNPAPSINVTLHALQGDVWTEVADSTTSATDGYRGRYEFRGLPSGTYALWFWYTNGENYPQEWWSDKPDRASSDLIELGTGTSVTADVRLDEGARIQGTLTDEAGVVVTGQWAQLYRDWDGAPVYVAKRWVSADGTYEFDRLRSGSYTIEFGGPDFVGEWWDDAPDQQAARRIDVIEGGTVLGVDAKLARPASLSMPTVSGSAIVGSNLTVAATSETPGVTLEYEWFADGSLISDATGPSLEVRPAQLGTVIAVRVTAAAPGYSPVSKESGPTGAVVAGTLTSSSPTIGGFAVTGSTLTANAGSWASGTAFAYRWFASGVAIDGATESTLKLTSAHAGTTITVRVTGTKAGYTTIAKTSAPTSKVFLVSTPTVSGRATVGSTLTARPGTWATGTSFKYQWFASGAALIGATGSAFRLTSSQVGKQITVRVTGALQGYATTGRTSAATSKVATIGSPTISGTAATGSILKVTPGVWTSGTSFAYQWYGNGIAIGGATGSAFRLRPADAGKSVTVRVTGSLSGYPTVARVTPPTGKVYLAPYPTVSGNLAVGSTLTAVTGTWTSGSTFTFQWYANGTAISGATSKTFKLTGQQAGAQMAVRVSGRLSGYPTTSRMSTPTPRVISTATPTISGRTAVGSTLSASPGTWTAGTAFKYQWYASGVSIGGATSRTFVLTGSQAGKQIYVRVTGQLSGYATVSRWSASTQRIVPLG